jgi:uncharacterized membrane protein YhaH (DUF805 family)
MEKSAIQWMVVPLRQYATFTGRARRREYWWFTLLTVLVNIVLGIVDGAVMGGATLAQFGGIGPLGAIAALALIIPGLAVSFRRMHDLDRSAWWLLLGLLPLIGGLILLYWYVQRGTVGGNRFGPDPLAGEA